jgi:hypothetical protein
MNVVKGGKKRKKMVIIKKEKLKLKKSEFQPKTLTEVIDYMEEKKRQGYDVYFSNGKPIIEYIDLILS